MNAVFDAAVIGGGPAGACTALQLARHGCSVALVEQTRFDRPRVGETIDPAIRTALEPLGLMERFRNANHSACVGMRCRWGSDEPYDRSFLFDPHGHAWHVDRRALDRMLFDAAVEAGAHPLEGTRLQSARREGGEWHLEGGTDRSAARTIRARFAVDASGRKAVLARRLGARRNPPRSMVATIGWFRLHRESRPLPPITQVDSSEDGWSYLAPQPESGAVLAHMGLPRFHEPSGSARAALTQSRLWREFLEGSQLLSLHGCRAESSSLDAVAGDRWVAVGDAAFTVDPLSGDGVVRGILMSSAAARAVVDDLGGSRAALDDYCALVESCRRGYREPEIRFYARERRWSGRPFWSLTESSRNPRDGPGRP